MSLKFTCSQDGVERVTVLVPVRLSREDLADVKEKAKIDGETWREWLTTHANLGIEEGLLSGGGELEQRYGRGGD